MISPYLFAYLFIYFKKGLLKNIGFDEYRGFLYFFLPAFAALLDK